MFPKLTRREVMRDAAVAVAGAALGLKATFTVAAGNPQQADTRKILSYNPEMEYRRCGKTGWMVSAVCLGGHWKRINEAIGGEKMGGWTGKIDRPDFQRNRRDVVTRCIERGINYIDACTHAEIRAYSKALKGRRDKMYLGWSWYESEARRQERRTAEALLPTLDEAMKLCQEDYVDLWRISCVADGRKGPGGKHVMAHTEAESEAIAAALDKAKKAGKARMTGVSSHDRLWLAYMMEKFPGQIDAVVTPYTAKTKVLPEDSVFQVAQKFNVGIFGIKPYSSGSLFKGRGVPGDPQFEADCRLSRLAIRYILCNPAITAPIPGMICVEQVDNAALAVKERRELDKEEKADLDRAMDRAWANLPPQYQFLRNWEYV